MSRLLERERGHVLSVKDEVIGSTIAAAASIGDDTIYVDDPTDYPEDIGELQIGADIYTYDSVDDDSGAIHLTSTLVNDIDETMRAYLYPRTTDRWAKVRVDDVFESSGGNLEARVPKALYPNLPPGTRRADGEEQVSCRYDEGLHIWIVEDAPGQDATVIGQPLGDSQRLYAEGDNYGSPFTLGGAASEVPWILNVDQVGTDVEIESSGPYADTGILFNATGLYSFYVHLEMDGDLITGEAGTRRVWLEKAEHIIENYNSGGPDFPSANIREALNAAPYDVTVWDRTWMFWMEAGERILVDASIYGEVGTVNMVRSVLVVRRLQ